MALDEQGRPTSFQNLQGRIHLGGILHRSLPRGRRPPKVSTPTVATAFIAFDLLKQGARDLRAMPLTARRAALEKIFTKTGSSTLRLSEQVQGDGRKLYARAADDGWEGIIAKRAESRYLSGKRTPDWRKVKINRQQEFVVGGWTEPRESRSYFGSLILGVYNGRELVYVGHVGTGFNERELDRVSRLLRKLETRDSPFVDPPAGNEKPHWVKPELVAQVKFTEWTADGILRHPVYLGLRDDKKATDVVREDGQRFSEATNVRLGRRAGAHERESGASRQQLTDLVAQLQALEDNRRNGLITLPDGDTLAVTNLHKVFWPKLKLTKGDLFRLLRTRRAVHPPGGRRSAARDEAASQRHHRGDEVLPAPRDRRAAGRSRGNSRRGRARGRRSSAAV